MSNKEIVVNEEYSKIVDCSDNIMCIIEILKLLNNACYDMTSAKCNFYSDDEELKNNAVELVRNKPTLYAMHYVIGEELEKLYLLSDTLNEEIYKFYYRKEEHES